MPRFDEVAVDGVLGGRRLPFLFGRQTGVAPTRVGIRFVEAHMAYGRVGVQRRPAGKRKLPPGALMFTPVKWRLPVLAACCCPTVRQPQLRIVVAARFDEGKVLAVGHAAVRNLECGDVDRMPRTLIVEGETLTVVAQLAQTGVESGPTRWCRARGRGVPLLVCRRDAVLKQDVLDVHEQQFLVLLLMLHAELEKKRDLRPARLRRAIDQGRQGCVNLRAIGQNLAHGRSSDQPPLRSRVPLADRLVIGVEEKLVIGMDRSVIWLESAQQKALEVPGGVGEMPLGGTDSRHRLYTVVFDLQRLTQRHRSVSDGVQAPEQLLSLRIARGRRRGARLEQLQAKVAVVVEPARPHAPAGGRGHRVDAGECKLVRVLGLDRLTDGKVEPSVEDLDMHALIDGADQMYLDPLRARIPLCAMSEVLELEYSAQRLVDPAQHVQVEGCGDALCIIIRSLQNRRVLYQVQAEEETTVLAGGRAHGAQEASRRAGCEVAEIAPQKHDQALTDHTLIKARQSSFKLRHQAADLQARQRGFEPLGRTDNGRFRDVNRHIAHPAPRLDQRVQKDLRLHARAATELGHGDDVVARGGDCVTLRFEDAALGAGQVILGELADRFKELRAPGVVKQQRRQRARATLETSAYPRGQILLGERRVLDRGGRGRGGGGRDLHESSLRCPDQRAGSLQVLR